jgi:hypothetical protein
MYKFLIYFSYLLTSALHVSGFLLAHLQRAAYNFGSGSSLLCMVSAPWRRSEQVFRYRCERTELCFEPPCALLYLKPTHYGHCVVLFMPKTHSLGFRLSPTEIEYVTGSVTVAGMSGMSWV